MTDWKPGPDLDALVAEKVMGWTPCEDDLHNLKWDTHIPLRTRHGIVGEELWRDEWGDPPTIKLPRSGPKPWAPTTSIADAWEVVEKVWEGLPKTGGGTFRFSLHRRDGDGLSARLGLCEPPNGDWVCEFAPDADGDWRTHAAGNSDTAPHAICLAALKAVGVEVGG